MNKLQSLIRKKKAIEIFNYVSRKRNIEPILYRQKLAYRCFLRYSGMKRIEFSYFVKLTETELFVTDIELKIRDELDFIDKVRKLKPDHTVNEISKITRRSNRKVRSVI